MEKKITRKISTGKGEGYKLVGRLRRRWKDMLQ